MSLPARGHLDVFDDRVQQIIRNPVEWREAPHVLADLEQFGFHWRIPGNESMAIRRPPADSHALG